jgi:hypothetical protein
MQIAVIIVFLALCISAPWIARKWRWGGLVWALSSVTIMLVAILLLQG